MASALRTPGSRLRSLSRDPVAPESTYPVSSVPPELIRRLTENFSTMTPWGWPSIWAAYQDSNLIGPGGFPYRGASGTTNDRAFGRDIPFSWSEVDLRGYRVTSRYLAETNPFAIGFCNLLVGYHVRKGYGWQACKKGAKKTPYATTGTTDADPLVAKAQRILDDFRDRNNWPLVSRECFYCWRVDGEVFLHIDWSEVDGIWCRRIEPEQVGAEDGSTSDPWSYGIGVRVYPDGTLDPLTPVEYHVWDLESGMTHGRYLDAEKIVHAKANVVANVKRGRPDFFPVLDLFDNVRKLYTNMLVTAVGQAAYAWLEQFPTATIDQVRNSVPELAVGNGQTVPLDQSCASWGRGGSPWWMNRGKYNVSPNTIMRTEGNRQVVPMPADTRGANFELIVKLAMRAARMRWNLPGSASGDAEDTTFAAAIQAGGPFPVAVEGNQLEWGSCFERPAALRVLDRAVDAGLLSREERLQLDVEVTEPAVVTPEPEKDTNRRQTLNAAQVLSVTTWQLQEGLDPQHEAENFKAEAARGQQVEPGQQPHPNAAPDDVSAPFGESRLIEKFTGIDANGHHWVNGHQVPAPKAAPASGHTGATSPDRAEHRRRSAVAAEHVRAAAQEPPRPKHLVEAAKFKDVARRRRIIAALKVEAELADAIGGFNEPDSRPADVLYIEDEQGQRVTDPEQIKNAMRIREASVKTLKTGFIHVIKTGRVTITEHPADESHQRLAHDILKRRAEAFEVKTLLTSAKNAVYMNPKAKARKAAYANRYLISFHVVAVDKRRGGKHSGHDVYVAPYRDVSKKTSGTVDLAEMKKVDSFAHVLGALA